MKELIDKECGEKAREYLASFSDLESKRTLVVSTARVFNIVNNPNDFDTIINLKRINSFRYINKVFEGANKKLQVGGLFMGCFETFSARRHRNWINKIPIFRTLYFGMQFIFMRVFPKVWGLKKIYFFVTKGKNRLLSKAEALGRLVSCGFEIVEYKSFNGLNYFVGRKVKEPSFNMNPSYGPIYKMPRVGKGGKIINVYKFRTMHPYAEYLQEYIVKQNGYTEIGKPAEDFRLTAWGKFMRKYWLDELPQLINVFKGEMKLVGARPLSKRFLEEYPKEMQEIRFRYKPGCFPPYVALLKQGVNESIEAEKIYFDAKKKHPYTTDTRFLLKAIYNILTNKIRSS
jgi:lipopolysaccharide/colanic/teichoic acid biosynthesis glycosyltransferase